MANIVFPYMELPENTQKEVLRTMDHKDLFAFSTLSQKSRNLVVSLNIPAVYLDVEVWEDKLEIEIKFPDHPYLHLVFNLAKPNLHLLPLDGKYKQISNGSTTTWRNPGFNFRELIIHLSSIFNFSTPSNLVFWTGDEIIRVEEVWDTFSSVLDYLIVLSGNSDEFAQKILRICLGTSKKLIIYRSTPLIGPILLRHVAIQNLDVLHLEHPINLNDLLLCNASIICAVRNQITQKTMNRFFRSWIKGSNRRLEYINFSFRAHEIPDFNILFKGISYKVIPDSVEKRVKKHVFENMSPVPEWKIDLVAGGIEIKNKFGISATVFFDDFHETHVFVWN